MYIVCTAIYGIYLLTTKTIQFTSSYLFMFSTDKSINFKGGKISQGGKGKEGKQRERRVANFNKSRVAKGGFLSVN